MTREESIDLVALFHEYMIVDITMTGEAVVFFLNTPYGELWNLDEHIIQLRVYDCKHIHCKYLPVTHRADHGEITESNEHETTDIDDIRQVQLLIQACGFQPPDRYEFFCSGGNILNGTLAFTASDFKIFDKNGKEISLGVLKEWAIEWWDRREKTGEEEEGSPGNSSII